MNYDSMKTRAYEQAPRLCFRLHSHCTISCKLVNARAEIPCSVCKMFCILNTLKDYYGGDLQERLTLLYPGGKKCPNINFDYKTDSKQERGLKHP